MKNTEVIFNSQTQPPIPCRIYQISKDGIHTGGSPINGRFPWRNARSVARGILRAWARDLIEKHDAVQLCAILGQWMKDWQSTNDRAGTNTDNLELPRLENILSSLIDGRLQRKAYFRQVYDSRDGSVMSHLSEEMLEAISHCLKKTGVKPRIHWEVESLPNDVGIYRILLKGGKHHES